MKSTILASLLVLGTVGCVGDDDPAAGPDAAVADGDAGVPNTGADGGDDPTGCTQAAHFLDVSTGSAGAAYPTPSLSVDCTDSELVVRSNGIPNFEFVPITPNPLTAQNYTWRLPRYPSMASQTSSVPLVGVAAIAVNGLPIFGPTEAPFDGSRDPYLDGILDYCNGHTAPGGVYHFHARPDCLFEDMAGNTHLVVAYALDGYPILAPYACVDDSCTATEKLSSSWRQIESVYGSTIEAAWDAHEYVEGLGDLDECNGRTLPDGSYAYYSTDTFPYYMGCYRGTPVSAGL